MLCELGKRVSQYFYVTRMNGGNRDVCPNGIHWIDLERSLKTLKFVFSTCLN